MLYNIVSSLAYLIIKPAFSLKIFGSENVPKKGGFILAGNHASYLDPIVLGAICPRKLNFMAKSELFRNPIFSWFLSKVGAFPVKRRTADISALKKAIKKIKDGNGLLMFPEGGRSENDEKTSPLAGIGFLALKTEAPVIPVFLSGTDKALPKGSKTLRFEKISVYFGKQVAIERSMPYRDIAQLVMDNIRHLPC